MRISSLLAAIMAGLVFQNEGLVLHTPSLQLRPTSLSLRWGRVPLRLGVPRLGDFPARQARPPCALSLTAAADGDNDLNMLQTALHAAIEREDYAAAAQYRDRIKEATDACGAQSGGWESLQVPPWLADRAERLGFRIPTQVQRNALETVMNGRDTVIRSPTGSGKTLAYLMPMLSLLSDDLLDDDIMLHLSRFQSKQATRGQRVSKLVDQELAPTPLGVIVVPTRELGVQVSTLCYMLVGGSRNNPTICQERIPPRYQPGSRTNMFTYKGPRRVKVVGVWDKEALNASMPVEDYGLNSLKGAHIIVTTPEYLEPLAARGHVPLSNARVVVVDEADTCLSGAAGPVLSDCFAAAHLKSAWAADGTKRVRILAGASILRPQVEEAAAEQMLAEPVTVDDGSEVSDAALVWAKSQRIPANIQHRYLVCDTPSLALGALAKLLRGEIAASQRRGEIQPRMIVYALTPPSASTRPRSLARALPRIAAARSKSNNPSPPAVRDRTRRTGWPSAATAAPSAGSSRASTAAPLFSWTPPPSAGRHESDRSKIVTATSGRARLRATASVSPAGPAPTMPILSFDLLVTPGPLSARSISFLLRNALLPC